MDVGSGGRGLRGPISEGMVRPSFCFLTSRRSSRGGGSSSAANADDPLRTWTSVRTSARAPPYASLGLEQADSRPCYTPSGPRRSCAGGVSASRIIGLAMQPRCPSQRAKERELQKARPWAANPCAPPGLAGALGAGRTWNRARNGGGSGQQNFRDSFKPLRARDSRPRASGCR